MALDTRDRRASALGVAVATLALVLPNPDGAALDQGDRQQTAFVYRGILAGSPIIIAPGALYLEGGFGFVSATLGANGFVRDVEGGG